MAGHQFQSRCATCEVPDGEHPVKEVVFNGQVLKVWDHGQIIAGGPSRQHG